MLHYIVLQNEFLQMDIWNEIDLFIIFFLLYQKYIWELPECIKWLKDVTRQYFL